ncbi:hypothetical protein ACI3L1_01920, partial [Deinococcus sp. SM5_A1]|uniref:hypothetical protein n=1 Tax=Deinococcus sp. SM5_A1 TaxID=3379094 RepID=UPI00385F5579
MSLQLVKSFQKRLEDIVTHGGTRNESSVRAAFQTLLNQLCGSVVPRGIMRWERILWVCRPHS